MALHGYLNDLSRNIAISLQENAAYTSNAAKVAAAPAQFHYRSSFKKNNKVSRFLAMAMPPWPEKAWSICQGRRERAWRWVEGARITSAKNNDVAGKKRARRSEKSRSALGSSGFMGVAGGEGGIRTLVRILS